MNADSSDAQMIAQGYSSQSWFGAITDPDADPLLGTTLGGSYRVVSVLGEGGMGRVYLAEHTRITGKRYAIKMLHPEFMRHPEAMTRFEREAEAAAALSHPNVVGVYDIDRAPDGRPFLVCELLEGVELGARLKQESTLPVSVAVRIARQLCHALAAAHARDIIHRDVKPENVFLIGDGWRPTVKVLDFGLSRLERAGDATLTRAGAIMGTPAYMAPEQALGKRVDARADVYGVGAILYRSLTGRSPFERDDPTATLAAVLTEEPPRPRSIAPEISEPLEAIVQRAMAKAPEERFQSMDELDQALSAFEVEETMTRDTVPASAAQLGQLGLPPPRSRAETATSLLRVTPYARPLLAVAAVAALLWAASIALTAAAGGISLATGRPVSELQGLEVGLLVAVVGATLMTPALLFLRHVRRYVWENTVRVGELVRGLTTVLLASAAAYGIAALAVQLSDGMLVPLGRDPGGGAKIPAAWPGWSVVFAGVSIVAAAAAAMMGRLSSRRRSGAVRLFAAPALAGAALLLASGVLYAGFRLRAGNTILPDRPVEAEQPQAASSGSAASPQHARVSAPQPSASAPEPPPEPAPAEELAAATKAGASALEALAERYPRDPAVARALVSLYAAKESSYPQALAWGEKLLALDAGEVKNETLRRVVLRAAHGKEPASGLAFKLMAESMESDGPDLLYDLMIASEVSAVRERAEQVLSRPEVLKRASPAARIAYELNAADSCADKSALLDRALADGDARSVIVLARSAVGSNRGCGRWRRLPCKPKCAAEAAKMREVMKAIEARVKAAQ